MDKTEFKDFSTGFVEECYRAGLSEEQTASLLVKAASVINDVELNKEAALNPFKFLSRGAKMAKPLRIGSGIPKAVPSFGSKMKWGLGGAGALAAGYGGYQGVKNWQSNYGAPTPSPGVPQEWAQPSYSPAGGAQTYAPVVTNKYSPYDAFYGAGQVTPTATQPAASGVSGGGTSMFSREAAPIRQQISDTEAKINAYNQERSGAYARSATDPFALKRVQELDSLINSERGNAKTYGTSLDNLRKQYSTKQTDLNRQAAEVDKYIARINQNQPNVNAGTQFLRDEYDFNRADPGIVDRLRRIPARIGAFATNRNQQNMEAWSNAQKQAARLSAMRNQAPDDYYLGPQD